MRREKKERKEGRIDLILISVFLLFAAVLIIGFGFVLGENSDSSDDANLTIWDDTGSKGGGQEKLTLCNEYCTEKLKNFDKANTYFYANFTNLTGEVINETQGNGDCIIRFNYTGIWTIWSNMTFNSASSLWEYNRTFDYKDGHFFEVNCTSDYGNITNLEDGFTISNTPPWITKTGGGYVDFDYPEGNPDILQCEEDELCTYNFSANVSEDDYSDTLYYSYDPTNTTLTNFTLNTSTGILKINVTLDDYTGTDEEGKKIFLEVTDSDPAKDSVILKVDITAVNDAPYFTDLGNETFNMSLLFNEVFHAYDEEDNTPFDLNISFINCSVAEWSDRGDNCTLFTEEHYTFDNITGVLEFDFTPTKNDVGWYEINFSVTDNSSLGDKIGWQVVNFTVRNINEAPYFRYICDDNRTAIEDSEHTCWVNVSDIDEINNLTITFNYTWFTFNLTGTDTITVDCSNLTDYNASAMVNFTPEDLQVGNWSVNITVTDTGGEIGPIRSNSTIFWFYIENINDSVSLDPISDIEAWTSENYTIYVNASDDDLWVPDKDVFDESLSFYSNNTNVSVSVHEIVSGTNVTTAKIEFDPNDLGVGNHPINISVYDLNNRSIDYSIFNITVISNTAPNWSITDYIFVIYEDNDTFIIYENGINTVNKTSINLSEYVTDAESDTITFSYDSDTSFPSFPLDADDGIIDFMPIDVDVGQHMVTIDAFDGISSVPKIFNFTIYNINDTPEFQDPITGTDVDNETSVVDGDVTVQEDNFITMRIYVYDDDFKIPQKSFYDENLTLNLTIQGPNESLFEFDSGTFLSLNETIYRTEFTPGKSDVGEYNITVNVTDASNLSAVLEFKLTVNATEHDPVLMNLTNQSSAVYQNLYYRINATDIEDGSSTEPETGNENFTFSYEILDGQDLFNSTTFNITTGEINITFNETQGGKHHINITVNDSADRTDSGDFWIFVYDAPEVIYPLEDYEFSLTENETFNFTFRANHSLSEDNLTYEFYIDNVLKYNISYYGDATNLTWSFTPNFTEETTFTGPVNLTLNVSNDALTTTQNWNLTINHTNYPLNFSEDIGTVVGAKFASINLSDYFIDVDASDPYYNQTIGFTCTLIDGSTSGGTIAVSVTDWVAGVNPTVSFSATETSSADYYITGYEYENSSYLSDILRNVTSNNFTVVLRVEIEIITVTTTRTVTRPVILKLILPEPVSLERRDRIVVPVSLVNEGTKTLSGIDLFSSVAKNGILSTNISAIFDIDHFDVLAPGGKKDTNLTIIVDTEEIDVTYEITVNATVTTPKFSDWGKIFVQIKEGTKVEEKILFTEEFLAENPECTELTELVKEARELYDRGDYTGATDKLDEAINACTRVISQEPRLIKRPAKIYEILFNNVALLSLIALGLGIAYYYYRRYRVKEGKLFKDKT